MKSIAVDILVAIIFCIMAYFTPPNALFEHILDCICLIVWGMKLGTDIIAYYITYLERGVDNESI